MADESSKVRLELSEDQRAEIERTFGKEFADRVTAIELESVGEDLRAQVLKN